MAVAAKSLLGVGLYSVSEAALYARVPTRTLSRWVYGDRSGEQVILPELDEQNGDKVVTFLDFVQALAIRRIRQERRVSLPKLREAYFRARDEFKVPYPLALDNTRIGLFGPPDDPSRQEVYICLEKTEDAVRQYFQLTGKKHGNQLIGEVVKTYSKRLIYDESGLATRYIAYKTDDGTIMMDPEVRFGEPYAEDVGYTARTLFDAYQSEGSVTRAAEVYGVPPNLVELAVEYFDYLRPPSAA
jgi:hypothetical protein